MMTHTLRWRFSKAIGGQQQIQQDPNNCSLCGSLIAERLLHLIPVNHHVRRPFHRITAYPSLTTPCHAYPLPFPANSRLAYLLPIPVNSPPHLPSTLLWQLPAPPTAYPSLSKLPRRACFWFIGQGGGREPETGSRRRNQEIHQ